MASGIVQTSNSSQADKDNDTSRTGTTDARPKLVQRLLGAGDNLPAFLQDLLNTQALVVAGTEAVAFLIDRVEGAVRLVPVVHMRPDQASDEVRKAAVAAFIQLLMPCVEQNREGAFEVGVPDDAGEPQFCLATVLRTEARAVGITAVITRCHGLERARQRLASMELVAGYFELFSMRQAMEQSKVVSLSHQGVLQLAGAIATVDGFEAATKNVCNELATRTGASRVAIGWVKGENIKLIAISHTEKFDKRQDLPASIIRVMEECLDQEEVVHYDPAGGGTETVSREAAAYSRANGNCSVVSVPLRRMGEVVGVILLEYPADHKPDKNAASTVTIAGDVLAPQLYDRYHNDRNIFVKVGGAIKHFSKETVGPKHTLAKLITVAVVLVLGVLIFFKPVYRVSAPFTFAAQDRRAIGSPADGFIGELGKIGNQVVMPGMGVNKGQLLVTLDTTELSLKKTEAQTRSNASRKEADQKLQEGKTAEAMIARTQAQAAQAEADLYDNQIKQASIVSPIDGEILRGDLRDRVGSAVKQGDTLFEIAGMKNLALEANVAERDIQMVKVGQKGQFATMGEPSHSFQMTVDRVVPFGEPKEAANVFKVYCTIDAAASPEWKPGMQGEVRIQTVPRRVVWIWTHRLTDLMRLKFWW